MAVDIVPMRQGDLARVKLQPAQLAEVTAASALPDYGEMLWRSGPAFTARRGSDVLACAGLQERQPHHAHAWAYVGEDARPALLAMTRAMRAALDACGYERVDMVVRSAFCQAHHWARLLGFAHEGLMRRVGPGGTDFDLYARISEPPAKGLS